MPAIYVDELAASSSFLTLPYDKLWGAGENLLEVVIDNEEKDLWHAFLQKGNHAMAARYANTQVIPHLQRPDEGTLQLLHW